MTKECEIGKLYLELSSHPISSVTQAALRNYRYEGIYRFSGEMKMTPPIPYVLYSD